MTESTIICQSALQYTHTNKENPKRGRRGKIMKKKLVGLMLSGMLVLSLAACGGDDAAAKLKVANSQKMPGGG